MAIQRFISQLRPRYNVADISQSQANDALRRNVQDLNFGPFVDGCLITNLAVRGNIPVRIIHNLNRPAQQLVVTRVISGINQITLRIDQTNVIQNSTANFELIARPSATGIIQVWVS